MRETKPYYQVFIGDQVVGGHMGEDSFYVPLDDFRKEFSKMALADSGLLPPVIKAFSSDFKRFIVERPPTSVKLRVSLGESGDKAEIADYELTLPWTIYLIDFSGYKSPKHSGVYLRIFFRNTQIFSEEDMLHKACIPNVDSDNFVCWGSSGRELLGDISPGDYGGQINRVINTFWASNFNLDFSSFLIAAPSAFQDLLEHSWNDEEEEDQVEASTISDAKIFFEAWSKLDVNEVLNLEFKEYYSVKKALDSFIYKTNSNFNTGRAGQLYRTIKAHSNGNSV